VSGIPRRGRGHQHRFTIELTCGVCDRDFDYILELPTAVFCKHCGSLVDARLSLRGKAAKDIVNLKVEKS